MMLLVSIKQVSKLFKCKIFQNNFQNGDTRYQKQPHFIESHQYYGLKADEQTAALFFKFLLRMGKLGIF